MLIEMWCDIICPWCGLAEHVLGKALSQFTHRSEVELFYRSYQVHPDLPRGGVTQRDLLAMHGYDPSKAEDGVLGVIERLAQNEGLTPFHAIERRMGPTDYAHELLAYASDAGVGAHAWKRMFRAHFGERRQFWTLDQVVSFAPELGLDAELARRKLESRAYQSSVAAAQSRATALGGRGTPFIVIDDKYTLSSARSSRELLDMLNKVWRGRYGLEDHNKQTKPTG